MFRLQNGLFPRAICQVQNLRCAFDNLINQAVPPILAIPQPHKCECFSTYIDFPTGPRWMIGRNFKFSIICKFYLFYGRNSVFITPMYAWHGFQSVNNYELKVPISCQLAPYFSTSERMSPWRKGWEILVKVTPTLAQSVMGITLFTLHSFLQKIW